MLTHQQIEAKELDKIINEHRRLLELQGNLEGIRAWIKQEDVKKRMSVLFHYYVEPLEKTYISCVKDKKKSIEEIRYAQGILDLIDRINEIPEKIDRDSEKIVQRLVQLKEKIDARRQRT